MFHFCNFYDLLTSTTQKIVCWSPVFKPDFYIFSYNEQLGKIWRNFMDKFLSYHTSLTLHFCFFGGFLISSEFVFFSAKRTTSLTDFPVALVHRKSKWIGKKNFVLVTKQHFLLSVDNLEILSIVWFVLLFRFLCRLKISPLKKKTFN